MKKYYVFSKYSSAIIMALTERHAKQLFCECCKYSCIEDIQCKEINELDENIFFCHSDNFSIS